MKTDTQLKLLKILSRTGKARPVVLAEKLGISAQALHRHLRKLTAQGTIVAVGSPPFTQYMLTGPDFEAAFDWVDDGRLSGSTTAFSETRDAMAGRLPRLSQPAEAQGPLIIATAGEVANNAFDHNLGHWRDGPGCWLEAQPVGRALWVCVADRGQGVRRSLSNVISLPDDQTALETAFNRVISGRAPERRGNGLKFVKKILSSGPGRGLAAASGTGRISFGELGPQCEQLVARRFKRVEGTLVIMAWTLE